MKKFVIAQMILICAMVLIAQGHELDRTKTWYLAHNLWYTDPTHIESVNFISGRFLPAGTMITKLDVIDDLSVSSNPQVSFEVRGKLFTVIIDRDSDKHLQTEDLLHRMFTSNTFEELTGNLTDTERQNILRGSVLPGMSKEAVIRTLGFPPDSRFEVPDKGLWIYKWDFSQKAYVSFGADGRVSKTHFPQ